ncbi:MAG: small multi-drug export protein [Methanoregula sp.]
MADEVVVPVLRSAGGSLAVFGVLAFLIPFTAAFLAGLPLSAVLGLVTSAFLIEYGAAPIGIALGLSPAYVFCTITCVEAGIFVLLYGILDSAGRTSGHIHRFLSWTRSLAKRSRLFDRYGIYGLFICEILLGVYICAPVARMFGWQEGPSFAITMAGYCVAALVTLLATLGIIRLFFA